MKQEGRVEARENKGRRCTKEKKKREAHLLLTKPERGGDEVSRPPAKKRRRGILDGWHMRGRGENSCVGGEKRDPKRNAETTERTRQDRRSPSEKKRET